MKEIRARRRYGVRSPVVVLRGPQNRVQMQVYDLTGPEVSEAIRQDTPKFSVAVLPASAHPSTAFVRGVQCYWGTDPARALSVASLAYGMPIDVAALPPIIRRYFSQTPENG